jgi:riboflavin kinase
MSNVSSMAFSKESVQKCSLNRSEYLNLPDLQFFLWCRHQYKLNRGVYNTIDDWFYNFGITQVIYRRIYILAFLEFVKENNPKQEGNKFIRFGNGGLTRRLQQFIDGINKVK